MFDDLNPFELSGLYLLTVIHYAWPVLLTILVIITIVLYLKKRTKIAIILSVILLLLFAMSVLLSQVI